ncbi:hypothetical protein H8356DRAFT_1630275 [Neocallimastix lanati (nom. inval.)]|uniref:Uncharacterized protein n=1 Tax=Neocallimastix californiae TaxID=1754190 RepID=A0A1Y2ES89_9FUNG|nr:hypothetical protein H8356DRAFT_1630275 [Neocallimastix sp. JGI-2020a]ORY74412.1 hypothetical protein LY90DRAFT_666213 [Neocallimastix californiae]|eukprot:ORY74412.1 hypothetical protein LY90DRAFT_666213 [Neocallimastix californiae]
MKSYLALFIILLSQFVWADRYTEINRFSETLHSTINICDSNHPCPFYFYTETGLFHTGHKIYMESCEANFVRYNADHRVYTVIECFVSSKDEKYGFDRLGIVSRTGDEIIDQYSYIIKLSETKMFNIDNENDTIIENNEIVDIADKDNIKLGGVSDCPSKIWTFIFEDGYKYEFQFYLSDMFFFNGYKLVQWNKGF